MAVLTETTTFESEGKARTFAATYRANFFGYDGEAFVYRCNLTGGWVVNASRYTSCD